MFFETITSSKIMQNCCKYMKMGSLQGIHYNSPIRCLFASRRHDDACRTTLPSCDRHLSNSVLCVSFPSDNVLIIAHHINSKQNSDQNMFFETITSSRIVVNILKWAVSRVYTTIIAHFVVFSLPQHTMTLLKHLSDTVVIE